MPFSNFEIFFFDFRFFDFSKLQFRDATKRPRETTSRERERKNALAMSAEIDWRALFNCFVRAEPVFFEKKNCLLCCFSCRKKIVMSVDESEPLWKQAIVEGELERTRSDLSDENIVSEMRSQLQELWNLLLKNEELKAQMESASSLQNASLADLQQKQATLLRDMHNLQSSVPGVTSDETRSAAPLCYQAVAYILSNFDEYRDTLTWLGSARFEKKSKNSQNQNEDDGDDCSDAIDYSTEAMRAVFSKCFGDTVWSLLPSTERYDDASSSSSQASPSDLSVAVDGGVTESGVRAPKRLLHPSAQRERNSSSAGGAVAAAAAAASSSDAAPTSESVVAAVPEERIPEYKITMLGTGGAGKTQIIEQLVSHSFNSDYNPTIEEQYSVPLVVDGEKCILHILDTAGQVWVDIAAVAVSERKVGNTLTFVSLSLSLSLSLSRKTIVVFYRKNIRR
jgi:Ras family